MVRKITFKSNPVTLVGRNLTELVQAPEFIVLSSELKEIRLSDFKDKIKIVTSFPSIDTPVCDLQIKEFNKRATSLNKDVIILGISKDLPFAQKRFCETFDIKNVYLLSDYKTSSFGLNYGLLIKELNLLARSIIIIDKSDIIRYIQVVSELTMPPDYGDALLNLKTIIDAPEVKIDTKSPGHCKPCEGGLPPMPKEKIQELLASFKGWEVIDDKKIVKEFKFNDFAGTKYFLDIVALLAQEQGHHPVMTISYNKLKITLTTHAVAGLSDNDFIMARIIDELF